MLDAHNDNASATLSGQLLAKMVANGAVAIAGSPDTGPVTAEFGNAYKIPTIGVVDDGGLTVYPKGPDSKPNPWVFDFGLNTFAWGAKIAEYALKHCPDGLAVLHDPSTYGEGGTYGIKQVYDKAGQKLAMNVTITENWSTGATAALMPQATAIKAAGIKCVDVWLTRHQAAFVQDLHTLGYERRSSAMTTDDDTYTNLAGDPTAAAGDAHLRPASEPGASGFPGRVRQEVQCRLHALRRDQLRQHHDAGPGDHEGQFDEAEGLAEGVQQHLELKGGTGDLGFTERTHITITRIRSPWYKYDAASKKWIEITSEPAWTRLLACGGSCPGPAKVAVRRGISPSSPVKEDAPAGG